MYRVVAGGVSRVRHDCSLTSLCATFSSTFPVDFKGISKKCRPMIKGDCVVCCCLEVVKKLRVEGRKGDVLHFPPLLPIVKP